MLNKNLIVGLTVFSALIASADPADPTLETVVQGWSLGDWAELNHVFLDPDDMQWAEVENSPWTQWDVEALSATVLEIRMANGFKTRVELVDGEYRDFGPVNADGNVGDPLIIPIVESEIRSPNDWRMVIQWPKRAAPGATQDDLNDYSELSMAGDMFFWSNWKGASIADMSRVSISVSRITPD